MQVTEWKEYFADKNLYTLDESDAEFAIQQVKHYGEERVKFAATLWHMDNLTTAACDNSTLKQLLEWEGGTAH